MLSIYFLEILLFLSFFKDYYALKCLLTSSFIDDIQAHSLNCNPELKYCYSASVDFGDNISFIGAGCIKENLCKIIDNDAKYDDNSFKVLRKLIYNHISSLHNDDMIFLNSTKTDLYNKLWDNIKSLNKFKKGRHSFECCNGSDYCNAKYIFNINDKEEQSIDILSQILFWLSVSSVISGCIMLIVIIYYHFVTIKKVPQTNTDLGVQDH